MDNSRNGLFTSSGIHRLMESPAKSKTYIKEKRREIKLKAPISIESNAYPLSWGNAIEGFVYESHLDINYAYQSKNTLIHESGEFAGTPDLDSESDECVGEIKCPFTRTGFIDLVDIIEAEDAEYFKEEKGDYYWQIVSNSILTNRKFGELIIFMPYEKEIPLIVEYIEMIDDFELQRDIQWVIHTDISRIPHIPNDSEYKNIYRFKFEIPESDKKQLIEKVNIAHKLKTS